jgi:hypothetical protein
MTFFAEFLLDPYWTIANRGFIGEKFCWVSPTYESNSIKYYQAGIGGNISAGR